MPLPWAAMGIGALIGGLGAKQRGGNFLKGALTGAALGGATGWIGGGKAVAGVGGKGGLFGFGESMMGNLGPLAMIGMGTEMAGQQEANLKALEGRRRMFGEEEDERLRRLSQIAGYDVADPTKFLTPQSYFGAARGGLATLPQYANGGWHNVPGEEPGPTQDPEIMQLPMGQEGSFEEENEGIVGLELAGLTDEEMSELQALQSLSIVTPEGDPNYEKIQIRLQELMGRMKVAKGGHINRPGYKDAGMVYDIDIDGEKYDFSFDEELTEEGLESLREKFDIQKMMEGMYDEEGNFIGDPGMMYDPSNPDGTITIPGPGGDMVNVKPMAQGGIADLDMRGGGHSIGPGTGTSDDVPAMLSDGEFVMTANAVRNLGGGDRMVGAQRMYNMMNSLDPNSQSPGEMNVAGYG